MLDGNITVTGLDIINRFTEEKEKMAEHAPDQVKEMMANAMDKMKEVLGGMSLSVWLPESVSNKFLQDGKKANVPIEMVEQGFNNFKKELANTFSMLMVLIYNSVELGESKNTINKLQMAAELITTDMLKKLMFKSVMGNIEDLLKGFKNEGNFPDDDPREDK